MAAAIAAASSLVAAGHREPRRLVDLAAQVEDGQAREGAEGEQEAPGVVRESGTRKIEATSGPTMRPAAWIANTAPTIRPRVFLPAYSLMIVAETG